MGQGDTGSGYGKNNEQTETCRQPLFHPCGLHLRLLFPGVLQNIVALVQFNSFSCKNKQIYIFPSTYASIHRGFILGSLKFTCAITMLAVQHRGKTDLDRFVNNS